MASVEFSLDRSRTTSMTFEGRMKFSFSVKELFLCFAASLSCLFAAFTVLGNYVILTAPWFTLLANLTIMPLLSRWVAESKKHPKSLDKEAASTLFTVVSTSENYKITFTPSSALQRSIYMGFVSLFPYLSAAFIVRKDLISAFLMLIFGLRTSLAMTRFWLSPEQLQSRWFQILNRFTGLWLCEETTPKRPDVEEKSEKSGPPVVTDEERESIKEKASLVEDRKSENGETKADLLDDDWEELNSNAVNEEEASQMGA